MCTHIPRSLITGWDPQIARSTFNFMQTLDHCYTHTIVLYGQSHQLTYNDIVEY